MDFSPIISRYPTFDDSAMIRVPIDLPRLCQPPTGGALRSSNDDVGVLYDPIAAKLLEQFFGGDWTAHTLDWVKQIGEASVEPDFDFFVWIGNSRPIWVLRTLGDDALSVPARLRSRLAITHIAHPEQSEAETMAPWLIPCTSDTQQRIISEDASIGISLPQREDSDESVSG